MFKKLSLIVCAVVASSLLLTSSSSSATPVADTSFEDGTLDGWNIGTQTGSLVNGSITGSGTGVTLINSAVTFSANARGAVGSPTLSDGSPNPYYAPAVDATSWTFSPYGTYAVALQPTGTVTFDDAITALGLTSTQSAALKTMMSDQAAASTYGSGNPTNAAWITKNVTLSAGTTYTMSWNYIGTDYVPFNDGSIASLTYLGTDPSPTVSVNNSGENYALLGFTNPGTGDYSTGTFGSTGWQVSTYEVSVSGEYLLGFAVFNLDDTALSPVLLVDSEPGETLKDGETFGAVPPNNPDAPTVAPTTPTTTTEPPATTTEPPATTQPAPRPRPRPAPTPTYTVTMNPDGGTCAYQGSERNSEWSVTYVGYAYLPSKAECSKDGHVFSFWAYVDTPTVSAGLPLLTDPTDGVKRYFLASNATLVASWEEVIPETVPDTVPDTVIVPDVPETAAPVDIQLPVTGSGDSQRTTALIATLLIISGAIIVLRRRLI